MTKQEYEASKNRIESDKTLGQTNKFVELMYLADEYIKSLETELQTCKDNYKLLYDTAMKNDHEFGLTMQFANRISELETDNKILGAKDEIKKNHVEEIKHLKNAIDLRNLRIQELEKAMGETKIELLDWNKKLCDNNLVLSEGLHNVLQRIAELEDINSKQEKALVEAIDILANEGPISCPALKVNYVCNNGNGCNKLDTVDTIKCWKEYLLSKAKEEKMTLYTTFGNER